MRRVYSDVINSDSGEELIEALTRCLADGWQPFDDPVVAPAVYRKQDGTTGQRTEYFQRVIKIV